MQIIPSACFSLTGLFVLFSSGIVAYAAPDATPAAPAAEAAPTQAPVAKSDPTGPVALRIYTADGLPVDVELVSIYRDEVKVVYVASKNTKDSKPRILSLAKLDKKTQTILNNEAMKLKQGLKALAFSISVEENSTKKEFTVQQNGSLILAKPGSQTPVSARTLSPGSRCLRLRASTNCGTDITAEAHIFWYSKKQRGTPASADAPEKVELNVVNTAAEYISKPNSISKATYQGYAVVIVNSANGEVLWRVATSGDLLKDALTRCGYK
ncbi:MAG: hypothetical protein LBV54_01835 [Puniceicoccales bacterium]|jgi:hypothetical protein|nr:hypothetical protein [Puniceicoccales bacterium]